MTSPWRYLLFFALVAQAACSGTAPKPGDPQAWRAALPQLVEQAQQDPGDLDLQARLATSMLFSGQAEDAGRVSKAVLDEKPKHALALYVQAILHEQSGNWFAADSIYRQRDDLERASKGLRHIMAARHQIASRQLMRRALRADLARAREREGVELQPFALVVEHFKPLSPTHRDSVLAVGVAHYLTNAFAQIDTLVVIDNTRRHLLEEEVRLSQTDMAHASSQLIARTVGASLTVGGRVGLEATEEEETYVQYGVEDLLLQPTDEAYRGTGSWVDLTSPTRYLLAELGEEVIRIAEELLHIPLGDAERDRLASPRTERFAAFLAFSEGLYWEERHNLGRAHESYQEAERLDPGYDDARDGSTRTGGGDVDQAPPPDDAPLTAGDESLEEEAIDAASNVVDDMPGQRSEEPPQTPGAGANRVRIIVNPQQ